MGQAFHTGSLFIDSLNNSRPKIQFGPHCRLCREISFQFRTRLPHGLLVYHNVKNPEGIVLDPYAMYVIVEKGQLKVVHVFGKHSTSVTVGEGLNRDEWHSVMVGPASPHFPLLPPRPSHYLYHHHHSSVPLFRLV